MSNPSPNPVASQDTEVAQVHVKTSMDIQLAERTPPPSPPAAEHSDSDRATPPPITLPVFEQIDGRPSDFGAVTASLHGAPVSNSEVIWISREDFIAGMERARKALNGNLRYLKGESKELALQLIKKLAGDIEGK